MEKDIGMNKLVGKNTDVLQPMESLPLTGKSSWVPHGLRRLFPVGFLEEIKEQFALGGPAFLTQIMVFLVNIVSTIFCGHLGKIELDSMILAAAIINVTGISVGTGLSCACDTLISQTYGSKNMKRVGTILQRGILILLLFCFPCWAIFINTENLLLLFKQNPEIARMAQIYVFICCPSLPFIFLYQLQTRYLQNQAIIWPQVITGIVVNILNAVLNAILLYALNLGLVGSAAANTTSQIMMCLLLFGYICVKKLYVETWGGWSRDCLQEWGSFMHLAFPSMLMICIEWWSFEIGGFLAGLISVVDLGAQAIMIQVVTLAFTAPYGFSVAASVRVGNALGAGDIDQAKLSTKASIACTGFIVILISSFVGGLKDYIAYVFTSERDIAQLLSRLLLIFVPFHVLDGIAITCGGVVRGAGKQKYGALINLVGYYVIGLPIGITLTFVVKLGVPGIWYGLTICVFLQAISFVVFILMLNWNKARDEAQVRAGVKLVKKGPEPTSSARESIPIGVLETGNIQSVNSNLKSHTFITGDVILPDIASSDKPTQQLVQEEDDDTKPTNIVGEVLTVKQLIIWRGLAVSVAVTILIIGIIVNLLLAK
ncbi:multidrug and toxin extrusion protein 2-like [Pelodytes ibericus]